MASSPQSCSRTAGSARSRWGETVSVGRVQLEVTVRCTKGPCPVEKAFDLITFRDNPTVFYGGQGKGDVLQQVEASSVAAAVEVKASPSGDIAAGGEYAKDIFALLWLATEYQAATFFVLLDKSSPRFRVGTQREQGPPANNWMTGQVLVRNGRVMKGTGEPAAQRTSLSELGIVLVPTPPAAPVPYVEVWTVQPGKAGQAWSTHLCYATLQPDRQNRHITVAEAKARARALLTKQVKRSA